MSNPDHPIAVATTAPYLATCGCGWTSAHVGDPLAAAGEGSRHIAAVDGSATAADLDARALLDAA